MICLRIFRTYTISLYFLLLDNYNSTQALPLINNNGFITILWLEYHCEVYPSINCVYCGCFSVCLSSNYVPKIRPIHASSSILSLSFYPLATFCKSLDNIFLATV